MKKIKVLFKIKMLLKNNNMIAKLKQIINLKITKIMIFKELEKIIFFKIKIKKILRVNHKILKIS